MHDDRAPFDLNTPFRQVPALGSLLLNLTQRALAFERLANIHRHAGSRATSPGEFAAQALEFLQVRFELDDGSWNGFRVPVRRSSSRTIPTADSKGCS
jgi:hypothetical protein